MAKSAFPTSRQPHFKEVPLKNPLGGLNKDLASEDVLAGQWQEHNNFHVFDGRIVKFGGFAGFSTLDEDVDPIVGPIIFGYDFEKLDGSRHFIFGTPTTLYLLGRDGVVSQLATGFGGTEQNRWQAAVMNDKLYLVNGVDPIQVFDGTTVADISADGKEPVFGKYILNSVNHLVVANLEYWSGPTLTPQRVQWSDIDVATTWLPTVSNEASYLDVTEGGVITGMAPLGPNSFFVYTERAITQFTYLGRPIIYSKIKAISDIGLYAPYSLVPTNDTHFFLGQSRGLLGFYAFGGTSSPTDIGVKRVGTHIAKDLNTTNPEDVYGFAHPTFPEIWWVYRDKSADYFTKCLVYNWKDDVWAERSPFTLSMLAEFYKNNSLIWSNATYPWTDPQAAVSWSSLKGERGLGMVGGD